MWMTNHNRSRNFLRWATIGLALLASPAWGDDAPGWQRETAGWSHPWSGLFFPTAVGDLIPVAPRTLDPAGHDLSIGYNAPREQLAITFFIYEKTYPDLRSGLREELALVRRMRPAMELGTMGAMKLPWLGEDPAPGVYGAYFQFEEEGVDKCAFLILAPLDEKVVKLRATWTQSDDGLRYAMERITAVMRAVVRVRR